MKSVAAHAKVNLALVVGGLREDGLHEVATIVQPVELADELQLTIGAEAGITVTGFDEDTLVRSALAALADAAGVEPCWHIHVDKRIPVAAGLGGGSADAAAALAAVNPELPRPLPRERLAEVAAGIGSDVPALLAGGAVLAEGAGERVRVLELPTAYWIALALPHGVAKASTEEVYSRFDELGGGAGFADRREAVLGALGTLREPRDFTALPPNDLARAAGRPRPPRLASRRGSVQGRRERRGSGRVRALRNAR